MSTTVLLFVLCFSTKCEKVSQKLQEERTASRPAGSDDPGSSWDAVTHGNAAAEALRSSRTRLSPVGGTASRSSDGVAPLSTDRRRELEHYLHLKRSEVVSPAFRSSWALLIFSSVSVKAGSKTGAAAGPKTRTRSLTRTRTSRRRRSRPQQPMRLNAEVS